MRKRGEFAVLCGRCNRPKEKHRIGRYSYCNACHAEYMREHRPKHRDLPDNAKIKANARAYAHVYLKRGKIKKEGCSVCGQPAQMHHEDYNKPTDIIWLCRKHHLELHEKMLYRR